MAKPTVSFNRLIFLTVRFGHPATQQISYKTIIGLTSHRIAAAPSKCKQYLGNNFVTALDFYRQRTTSPPPWNSFNGFFLWLHFLPRLMLNISLWFLGLLMQLKSEKMVIPTKIRCSLCGVRLCSLPEFLKTSVSKSLNCNWISFNLLYLLPTFPKQGKKVCKTYCGPMLLWLACVYLFLFPRGATKCSGRAKWSPPPDSQLH